MFYCCLAGAVLCSTNSHSAHRAYSARERNGTGSGIISLGDRTTLLPVRADLPVPADSPGPAGPPGPAGLAREVRPRIGAHVPVSGGLAAEGLRYAAAIGAEAIQVFVSNPRAWSPAAGDAGQDEALREHAAATGLPVYVHAAYLINVGSPDPVVRQRSVASLAHSLRRGTEIGARGVVVHTGSATMHGDRETAMRHARECLLPLLESIADNGPDLLLEPMAGQGGMLCAAIGDLPPYLDNLDWHPRAGVCLDTCHAFAAGHDLAAPDGAARLLADLETAGGRLTVIHANDSKDGCGSRRDRHENIGAGQIGTAAFGALLRHPAVQDVPFILETPGPRAAHAADVAALTRLREQ
jgi:deoxyribonuclease-4